MKYLKLALVLLSRNIRWLLLKLKNRNHLLETRINNYKMLLNLTTVGFDFQEKNIFKQLALNKIREEVTKKL